jgi:hypothetical protein
MNSHQKSDFSEILKEIDQGGDQETAGEDPIWGEPERSCSELTY